ncbi:hypothetical protein MMC21_003322 [Puttea exsequens]|nr:hypothetical protein [Puttea exsequens]
MYLDDSCEEQESFIGSALQEAEMFRSATIFSLNLRDDGSGLKNILLPGLDDRENRPILAKLQKFYDKQGLQPKPGDASPQFSPRPSRYELEYPEATGSLDSTITYFCDPDAFENLGGVDGIIHFYRFTDGLSVYIIEIPKDELCVEGGPTSYLLKKEGAFEDTPTQWDHDDGYIGFQQDLLQPRTFMQIKGQPLSDAITDLDVITKWALGKCYNLYARTQY